MKDAHRIIAELAAAMTAAGMPHDQAQEFRDELMQSVVAKMAPHLRAIRAAKIAHEGPAVMVERLGCSRRNAYYLAAKGRAILRAADCTEA